jgi:Domain of unknown function (DUF4390)
VNTTVSSTPCFASGFERFLARLLHGLLACVLLWACCGSLWAQTTEVNNLRVEQSPEGLVLSATLRFELPAVVEEALLKGIPMTFVAEAQVFRDRWYWYDKAVVSASRSVRLAYQPLTRRWRISVSSGVGDFSSGASLSQSFDRLEDAMAVVRRVSAWKIADISDLDTDSRHNIVFRYRLDISQLPRPMQIGITGNADWNISVQRSARPDVR